jgi:hypothetical protein
MKQRCSNKRNKAYKHYGGRGITYCAEWESWAGFYADMGERPKGYTLERVDVNGNYCPENCIWLEKRKQGENKRPQKSLPKPKVKQRTKGCWVVTMSVRGKTKYFGARSTLAEAELLNDESYYEREFHRLVLGH